VRGWGIGHMSMPTANESPYSVVTRRLFVPLPGATPAPAFGVLTRVSSEDRPGSWRDIPVGVGDVARYDERLRDEYSNVPPWSIARLCSSAALTLALHGHLRALASGPAEEPSYPEVSILSLPGGAMPELTVLPHEPLMAA
jgi:hypothetical protein